MATNDKIKIFKFSEKQKLIYNDLLEVINTKSEFKELFRYLLKYQTNIIKEEAQSVFGYEVLYKSIINDKVDYKALELFEDLDIYKLEEDKTKMENHIIFIILGKIVILHLLN